MITLFKANEKYFTHNGLGNLDNNIIDPIISEDLNGIYQLTFRYPLFAKHGLEIKGQSIIRVPSPNVDNQLFRVYRPIKSMGYLVVNCYHIFYDLIDNFIEDTNVVNKNGQGAIRQLLGATQYGHVFKAVSDIESISNARIVRMNPIEAILDQGKDNSFVNRWGGEIKRNNFDIEMLKSIGSNKGKEIRHRKDLIGYESDVDWSNITTRIMPKGFDGLLLPEKYVDSPFINSYVKPKIEMIDYPDIKAAIGEYADDEDAVPLLEAYELLRIASRNEYSKEKIDIPKANYKIDFVSLEKTEEYKDLFLLQDVLIGDTVTVKHEEDNIDITAKVISYRYDPMKEEYIEIELGNFQENSSDNINAIKMIDGRVNEINDKTKIIEKETGIIRKNVEKKNSIYYIPEEPVKPSPGDLWVESIGSKSILKQFTGISWVPIDLKISVSGSDLTGTIDFSDIEVTNFPADNLSYGNIDLGKVKIINGIKDIIYLDMLTGKINLNVDSIVMDETDLGLKLNNLDKEIDEKVTISEYEEFKKQYDLYKKEKEADILDLTERIIALEGGI